MDAVINSPLINAFRNIGESSAQQISGQKIDGVCFDYALLQFFIDKDYNGSCWNAFLEVKENFEQISFDKVEVGDMVVYHECRPGHADPWRNQPDVDVWGEIEHFGIVLETNPDYQKMLIQSKWGWNAVHVHELGAVPNIYGTHVSFWRHKENMKADIVQNKRGLHG